MSLEKLKEWIGRTQFVEDLAAPFPVRALAATLDEGDPDPRNGDPLPPLWHWLYFLEIAPQSKIGPDGHAAVVRSYAGGAVLSVRPLSRRVLEPLLAWLVARGQAPRPSDPGGILLERAGHRVRASVTVNNSGTGWLVLEPAVLPAPAAAPPPTPPGTEICLHEAAEGDVFCPSCGVAL